MHLSNTLILCKNEMSNKPSYAVQGNKKKKKSLEWIIKKAKQATNKTNSLVHHVYIAASKRPFMTQNKRSSSNSNLYMSRVRATSWKKEKNSSQVLPFSLSRSISSASCNHVQSQQGINNQQTIRQHQTTLQSNIPQEDKAPYTTDRNWPHDELGYYFWIPICYSWIHQRVFQTWIATRLYTPLHSQNPLRSCYTT